MKINFSTYIVLPCKEWLLGFRWFSDTSKNKHAFKKRKLLCTHKPYSYVVSCVADIQTVVSFVNNYQQWNKINCSSRQMYVETLGYLC